MGFLGLFKKKGPPKEVRDTLRTMMREEEGRKLADEAISYRNVGNFQKAFELLKRAATEFDYKPARVLIGTTAVLKGDIEGAIGWFEVQIKELEHDNEFPLIELYANLGSIYSKCHKDYARALEIYVKALQAPRPAIIADEGYSHMESNVYHDMAIAYCNLGDAVQARQCAEKRMQVEPDCPDCKKVLAFCEGRGL